MLNLTRREGETLVLDHDIRVTIYKIRGNQVRIAIEAPDDVDVIREELLFDPELQRTEVA